MLAHWLVVPAVRLWTISKPFQRLNLAVARRRGSHQFGFPAADAHFTPQEQQELLAVLCRKGDKPAAAHPRGERAGSVLQLHSGAALFLRTGKETEVNHIDNRPPHLHAAFRLAVTINLSHGWQNCASATTFACRKAGCMTALKRARFAAARFFSDKRFGDEIWQHGDLTLRG